MKKFFEQYFKKGLPSGPNEQQGFSQGFIVSKRGQWDYPGLPTMIPNANGRITMKGVYDTILGIDDQGNSQIMYSGGEYQFPGNHVFEIPLKQTGGASDTDYISVNPLSVFGATPGLYTQGYERPTMDLTFGRRNIFPNLTKRSDLESISGSLTTSLPYQNNTGVGVQGSIKAIGNRWENLEDLVKANVEAELAAGYDPNMGTYATFTGSPQFTFGNVQPTASKIYKGNLRAGEWLAKAGPYGGVSYTPGRSAAEESASIPFGAKGNFNVGIGGGKTLGASGYFGVDPFGQASGQYSESGLKGRTNYGFDIGLTLPFGSKQKRNISESFKNIFADNDEYVQTKPSFFQDGGEYLELDLTSEEIEEYRKGGYIVEDISVPELTKAQRGLFKKSKSQNSVNVPTIYQNTDEAFPLPTTPSVPATFTIDYSNPYTIVDPKTGLRRPMTEEEKAIAGKTFMQDWATSPMAKSMLRASIEKDAPYGDLEKHTNAIANLRRRATSGDPVFVSKDPNQRWLGRTGPHTVGELVYSATDNPEISWEEAIAKGMATVEKSTLPTGGTLYDYKGTNLIPKTEQDRLNIQKFFSRDFGNDPYIYLEDIDKMGIITDSGDFTTDLSINPEFATKDWEGEHAYVYPHEYSHNQDMAGTLMPMYDYNLIKESQSEPLFTNDEYQKTFTKYFKKGEDWDRVSFEKELADLAASRYPSTNAYQLDKSDYEKDFAKFKGRFSDYLSTEASDNKLPYDEFLKKYAKPKFYTYLDSYQGYINSPTETRARLNALRMYGQQHGIYNPFYEPLTPEKFQELIKSQEKQNPGLPDANQLQQLRRSYSDEEILNMLNTISKNNSSNSDLTKAQKGITQKGITISDPEEYMLRKVLYDDSLQLHKQSLNQTNFGLKPVSKEKYNEIVEWQKKQPKYSFDEVSYQKDLKNKTVKNFENYVYNIHDPKEASKFYENVDKHYQGNPMDFAKTLPDGRIKIPGYVYKGKPDFEYNYTIYDPRTGTYKDYFDNKVSNVWNEKWKPEKTLYYGADKPDYSDVISVSSINKNYKNNKLKSSQSKSQKFVSPYWLSVKNDIYKKPVQPVYFKKTASIPSKPVVPEIGNLPIRPAQFLSTETSSENKDIIPMDYKFNFKPSKVAYRTQTVMEPDPDRPGEYRMKESRKVPYATTKMYKQGDVWEDEFAPRVVWINEKGEEVYEDPRTFSFQSGGLVKAQEGIEKEQDLPGMYAYADKKKRNKFANLLDQAKAFGKTIEGRIVDKENIYPDFSIKNVKQYVQDVKDYQKQAADYEKARRLVKDGTMSEESFLERYNKNKWARFDQATRKSTPEEQAELEETWYGPTDEQGRRRWMSDPRNVAKVAQAVAVGAPLAAAAPIVAPAVGATLANPLVQAGLTGYGVYDAATNTLPEAYRDFQKGDYGSMAGNLGWAALDLMPGMVFDDMYKAGKHLEPVGNIFKGMSSKAAFQTPAERLMDPDLYRQLAGSKQAPGLRNKIYNKLDNKAYINLKKKEQQDIRNVWADESLSKKQQYDKINEIQTKFYEDLEKLEKRQFERRLKYSGLPIEPTGMGGGQGKIYQNKLNSDELIKLGSWHGTPQDMENLINAGKDFNIPGIQAAFPTKYLVLGKGLDSTGGVQFMPKLSGKPYMKYLSTPESDRKLIKGLKELDARNVGVDFTGSGNIMFDPDTGTVQFVDLAYLGPNSPWRHSSIYNMSTPVEWRALSKYGVNPDDLKSIPIPKSIPDPKPFSQIEDFEFKPFSKGWLAMQQLKPRLHGVKGPAIPDVNRAPWRKIDNMDLRPGDMSIEDYQRYGLDPEAFAFAKLKGERALVDPNYVENIKFAKQKALDRGDENLAKVYEDLLKKQQREALAAFNKPYTASDAMGTVTYNLEGAQKASDLDIDNAIDWANPNIEAHETISNVITDVRKDKLKNWSSIEGKKRLQNMIDNTPWLKENGITPESYLDAIAGMDDQNLMYLNQLKELDKKVSEQLFYDAQLEQGLISQDDWFKKTVKLDENIKDIENSLLTNRSRVNSSGVFNAYMEGRAPIDYDEMFRQPIRKDADGNFIPPKVIYKNLPDSKHAIGIGEANEAADLKQIIEHEIAHLLQKGSQTNLDKELETLSLKDDDLFTNMSSSSLSSEGWSKFKVSPEYFGKSKRYFQTGSKGMEKLPFLVEVRQDLLDRGVIKDVYDEITPEMLKTHYNKYMQGSLGGDKTISLRIFDIMKNEDSNFNLLSKVINKAPVLLPAAGVAGTLGMMNSQTESQEPFSTFRPLYQQGGLINNYKIGDEITEEEAIRLRKLGYEIEEF